MARRQAFGTVVRERSGNYRARYGDPRHTGPGRAPWVAAPQTFATKRAAEAWLARVRADLERGTWKHPDQVAAEEEAARAREAARHRPFGQYATDWLATRPLTRATRDSYRSLYTTHLAPRWAAVPLRQVTTADVRSWVATDLAPGRPGARKHAYDLFRTIMATAVEDDLLDTSPCKRGMLGSGKAGPGTSSRHAPRALTPAEVVALADEVPAYMRVLVLLLCTTGMRSGELRELRVRDLDLRGRSITVTRAVTGSGRTLTVGTPKTTAGVRTVHLDAATARLLADHLAARGVRGRDALVFPSSRDAGTHMPQRTMQINIARACRRLGIEHTSPHDFRNTAASLAGRTPGVSPRDVQEMLGQSTPGMALRYMRSDEDHQRRISAAVADEVLGAASAGVTRISTTRTETGVRDHEGATGAVADGTTGRRSA